MRHDGNDGAGILDAPHQGVRLRVAGAAADPAAVAPGVGPDAAAVAPAGMARDSARWGAPSARRPQHPAGNAKHET